MGIHLVDYKSNSVTTTLNYSDNSSVVVFTWDFNRAFGTIINSPKDVVIAEYAI